MMLEQYDEWSLNRRYMGNEKMSAPPITTLRELEVVAYPLSSRRIDDLDALRKWLAVLVTPIEPALRLVAPSFQSVGARPDVWAQAFQT